MFYGLVAVVCQLSELEFIELRMCRILTGNVLSIQKIRLIRVQTIVIVLAPSKSLPVGETFDYFCLKVNSKALSFGEGWATNSQQKCRRYSMSALRGPGLQGNLLKS